jgi:hypothetical protein
MTPESDKESQQYEMPRQRVGEQPIWKEDE